MQMEGLGCAFRGAAYGSASAAGSSHREHDQRPARAAREYAALGRVATLVTGGVEPREVFAAVTEEVSRVVDAPSATVARYNDDRTP
jgi:hypothetical protein